jgi:N-methylhydantoinase A
MYHVGVDTGGTFTDTVLIGDETVQTVKTLTTDDLIGGIVEGFESICELADVDPGDVTSFNHGSTVAVNALIEKTGAKTALLTTEGFEDVLEIGEAFRDRSLLYAPCGPDNPPLVPRKHRHGVAERLTAAGEVEVPLDDDSLDALLDTLDDGDFESVAVSLLHAYENDDHERAVVDALDDRLPGVAVSRSSAVSPEIREYSRTSTTVADAYIKPTVTTYIEELKHALSETGYDDALSIMNSSGGVAGPTVATKRPVTQILSGPVAGVQAAQYVGERMGIENIITLDMGGTSCDTTLIESGDPVEVPHRREQGMKINGPFVNIETVGAGGGSIAWLDEVDALRVGPESAGSNPGPVCYGLGGTRPTVTDADLHLGILNPENFAGGEIELDAEAASIALDEHVASPLGMSTTEAAVAIRDVTDGNMASALRVVSVKQGYDPRDFALMGFGGAGPMHSCNVAAELDIDTVVFPNNPGLLSALGLVVSDFEHEYVQSLVVALDDADPAAVDAARTTLVEEADQELAAEGVDLADRSFDVSIDVRYTGQSNYLNVPLAAGSVGEGTLDSIADRFESLHEDRFGFVDDVHPIELVNVRLTARGATENPDIAPVSPPSDDAAAAKAGTRPVVVDVDEVVETPYYDGERLGPGHSLDGPAVVELENSTIWIPPMFDAHVDDYNNIVATRGASQ